MVYFMDEELFLLPQLVKKEEIIVLSDILF